MTNTLTGYETQSPLESGERMTITRRLEVNFNGISVPVHHVDVPDPFYNSERPGVTAELTGFNEILRNNPPGPQETIDDIRELARRTGFLVEGGVLDTLTGPEMDEWRKLLRLDTSALALEPVYDPTRETMGRLGLPYSKELVRVYGDTDDGVGIRSRGKVTTALVLEHVERVLGSSDGEYPTLSIACGAARPILDLLDKDPRVTSTFFDINPEVLKYAADRARERGSIKRVTTEIGNLVTKFIRNGLSEDEKATCMGIDAMGIVEYFGDVAARELLKNGFAKLKPGGMLVFGNMLTGRGQEGINQRVAQWPHLHMRTIEEDLEIIQNAGLPVRNTRVYVPQDGVYAIFAVEKDSNPTDNYQSVQAINGLGATATPGARAA
jgi:SAM-dependent methyltransferase